MPNSATPQPRIPWLILICQILIAMVIFFIALVILCAALPRLPDFSIQSLSLSNYNSSSQGVTATWKAQFQVSNPNKKAAISFAEMASVVLYKGRDLAHTKIGPWEQGARNSSKVDASYAMVDAYVDGKAVDAMNAERRSGQVKFHVKVFAYVEFGNGWTWLRRLRGKVLRVWCNDVALTSASAGKMTGGPKTCRVRSI